MTSDIVGWLVGLLAVVSAFVSVVVTVYVLRQEGFDLSDLKSIVRRALHMREDDGGDEI